MKKKIEMKMKNDEKEKREKKEMNEADEKENDIKIEKQRRKGQKEVK